ncbi:hypothetical protein JTB14_002413 [Gonioctena quinquepunctata]|nr:hypothetical protein JTB14_002413 [Gonioctena quinquepunctata]
MPSISFVNYCLWYFVVRNIFSIFTSEKRKNYQAFPKLSFDNVKIGESSVRKLLIKNPTSSDITLYLVKSLPEELNASYSWVEKTIGKGSDVTFEME